MAPATASVFVLGSVNRDLLMAAERLPRAGETVAAHLLDEQLGGKGANQAVASARAGVPSLLIATVGDDPAGDAMLAMLADHAVDIRNVARVATSPTGQAFVVTARGENQIVVIAGANAKTDAAMAEACAIRPGDVALTQLETPAASVAAFLLKARAVGATSIFNPAPAHEAGRALMPLADVIVVNETELEFFTRSTGPRDQAMSARDLAGAIDALALRQDQVLIVTMGGAGSMLYRDDATEHVPAFAVDVVDTTGAGDCFCGFLGAGLARRLDIGEAARDASAAAALSVGQRGGAASIPDRSRVLRFIASPR
ncbi:ribokinase [Sphingomonas profundi]|uniref:ribokinase n=1 Tax=Alterirhizorhabdus profundi TaxID=2681549 RepID=UPI0012E88E9A|nr:ribokinase [Sphingomonas profundi]